MSAVRAFVALPLPAAYQDGLAAVRRDWSPRLRSRLSWTRPGNWHLTLKFLGDVEESLLPRLAAALGAVRAPRFVLQGGGGGFFPPRPEARRRWQPRVLWVGLARGAAETAALASAIEKALLPLGFPAEGRPFSAHLTLARIKWSEPDPWDEVLADLAGRPWPEFPAAGFTLYRSALGPGGPQYAALSTFAAE
ncbi:MAG: RNA 2',3'-cyclic phosphodiesterase [Thermodesulfobacteriota bacterium]